MKDQLKCLLEQRVKQCVSNIRNDETLCPKIEAKKEACSKRSAEIVKAKAKGKIVEIKETGESANVAYEVHLQYLIKQKGFIYLEEEMELRNADFFKGILIKDEEAILDFSMHYSTIPNEDHSEEIRASYKYDRLKAVKYAEKWWNSHNPAFKTFKDNDCTNFISQCLYTGGAPMRGRPNRGSGWWMSGNNWSWSWAIAHAFRLYLGNSKTGLRAREVSSPKELLLGDVICYDFEGDGRFNHNTIVTGRDANGMPLVNAHSYNSRMRYWAYEDSTAYTPNIKYKFFTIVDDE